MHSSKRSRNTAGIIAYCLMSVLWPCRSAQGAEQVVQNGSIAASESGSTQARVADNESVPVSALPPSVFSCSRASDAYLIDRNGATLFGPNVLRTEKVTSFTSHEGIVFGTGDGAEPLAIDYANGDILGKGINDATVLVKTKDGNDYTTIVDFAAHPLISGDGFGAGRLSCVVVTGDYLVMWLLLGSGQIQGTTGNPIARAYRMTRGSGGQWDPNTIVNLWESIWGYSIHWQANHRGNEVMWGEYIRLSTGYDPQRRGCGTFYIDNISVPNPASRVTKIADDPGVTPVTGDPPVVVITGSGSHMHSVLPDPTRLDTWYLLNGDGIGNDLRVAVKPPGWVPGQMFTISTLEYRLGSEGFTILNDELYLGIEGSDSGGEIPGHLVSYDLSDHTKRTTHFFVPFPVQPINSGSIAAAPTFNALTGKSTVTADTGTFASADVDNDLLFAATAQRYLITDFVSGAQVLVNADASGEGPTDTFEVIEPGGPYKLSGYTLDGAAHPMAYNGAVYQPLFIFQAAPLPNLNKGLYVGMGGDHFSTFIRFTAGHRGIHHILGVLDGKFVCAYETGAPVVKRVAFIPIPQTQTVDAIVVEKGSQNVIGSASPSDSFEGVAIPFDNTSLTANGWWLDGGNGPATFDANAGLERSTALNIRQADAARNTLAQQWWSNLPNLPPAGLSLQSFSMWIRSGFLTPTGFGCLLRNSNTTLYPSPNLTNKVSPGTRWQRTINTAKSLDPRGAAISRLVVRQNELGLIASPNFANAELFYDAPMLEIDMDRWRTFSSTWLPIGIIRPDEVVSTAVDLTTASAWSLFFEWHPLEARENFLIDIPIVSVEGATGSFLEVWWDHITKKFKVTDATGTTHATTQTNWRHLDAIKFILASDGEDTTLHIWDPEQTTQSTDMPGIKLSASASTILRLGMDVAMGEIGCGRYADIRLYQAMLTNSEAITAFATMGVAPCVGIPLGDFISPMGVDGLDVQPFVDALTSASPTQDQVCRGDFNGNAALDDGDVNGMVTALLDGT